MSTVYYTAEHWETLGELRCKAILMLEPLTRSHIQAFVYGSVSRGDIHAGSDIDVFIPTPPAPGILEVQIERAGYNIQNKEIIQATPSFAAKGYIYVDDNSSYSFPLTEMKTVEQEFYMFAGRTSQQDLETNTRKPGVDKRLMLIEPTEDGHFESPIQGREDTVAKLLNIQVQTVRDRVRTLLRREHVGRTGVYLKSTLNLDESFGEKMETLSRTRPELRRKQRRK